MLTTMGKNFGPKALKDFFNQFQVFLNVSHWWHEIFTSLTEIILMKITLDTYRERIVWGDPFYKTPLPPH